MRFERAATLRALLATAVIVAGCSGDSAES